MVAAVGEAGVENDMSPSAALMGDHRPGLKVSRRQDRKINNMHRDVLVLDSIDRPLIAHLGQLLRNLTANRAVVFGPSRSIWFYRSLSLK